MSLSSDGTVMTMPVQPAYQGNGNGMWGRRLVQLDHPVPDFRPVRRLG